MAALAIPLASCADEVLRRLTAATGSASLGALTGATLLGERAMLAGMRIPGRVSAGGGCRLLDALNGTIALNLSRAADRELLPALFGTEALDVDDEQVIASHVARCDARSLVERGRAMGLAIAAEDQSPGRRYRDPCVPLTLGCAAPVRRRSKPRVVDLSALWAGPLASHLLWLAGAEVIKVESRKRPDAMRNGDAQFYSLLNQRKSSVVIDLADHNDQQALLALIATADVVIEASRPRALAQHGFDAAKIVGTTPGLVWVTITGHGATDEPASWVGFGDDCGVAAGLSATLRAVTGRTGFVGDAIGDPLTGIFAADAIWRAWQSGGGGRIGIALRDVVAHCLARSADCDPETFKNELLDWSASVGEPFQNVQRRNIGTAFSLGEHTHAVFRRAATC